MRPKIVLFGDSITEESYRDGGWGASLAHQFSRTADVILRGFSGYNTRWALKVVERVFEGLGEGAKGPAAVAVFFGANDASLPDRSSAFQHVPLLEYQDNLRSILSFLNSRWPHTVVLFITPPPIDEDGRLRNPYGENNSGLPERTNESAGTYAQACITVARESGILVVDLWSKMQQFSGWETAFLSDGLHLTAEGNRVVFNEVVEKLRRQGVSLEAMLSDLPLISVINPNDPLKAFDN